MFIYVLYEFSVSLGGAVLWNTRFKTNKKSPCMHSNLHYTSNIHACMNQEKEEFKS